uniref:Exoribonuclease phosphorolytic domain-containing protein n=1 Tax=Kalanchoe fedtschenkoi TaxID=63787 RepID=A0A7N1A7J9_KALFE
MHRRSTEISLVIRQTMEACILTHLMPRSQIGIFVQVLQADGGTRSACINAATLALNDAGIPMSDAGYLNNTPLLGTSGKHQAIKSQRGTYCCQCSHGSCGAEICVHDLQLHKRG